MSKEKVDAYRQSKANRKEELEKAKKTKSRNRLIANLILGACALALVVALAVTVVNSVKAYQASRPDYNVTEMAVSDYTSILSGDEVVYEEAE